MPIQNEKPQVIIFLEICSFHHQFDIVFSNIFNTPIQNEKLQVIIFLEICSSFQKMNKTQRVGLEIVAQNFEICFKKVFFFFKNIRVQIVAKKILGEKWGEECMHMKLKNEKYIFYR